MRALALVVVLLSSLSFAQETPKPKNIDFDEGEFVEGTLHAPDPELVSAINRPRFESLIRVRKDFRDKVLRSEADLH